MKSFIVGGRVENKQDFVRERGIEEDVEGSELFSPDYLEYTLTATKEIIKVMEDGKTLGKYQLKLKREVR